MKLGLHELIEFHRQKAKEAKDRSDRADTSECRIINNSVGAMYLKTIHMLEKLAEHERGMYGGIVSGE